MVSDLLLLLFLSLSLSFSHSRAYLLGKKSTYYSLATVLINYTHMDSSQQQQKQDDVDVDVMEVPEVHGDLLMELLDASLAAENAAHHHHHHHHQQLGLAPDGDGDGDCWIDDNQENYDNMHAHQGCEDCRGLLDGILSDFDDYDGSPARPRSPPAPYRVVFGHDDDTLLELEWAEEAAMDPFATTESAGGWYMDGLVMAMAWDEQQDGGGFPFEPCYGYEGEAGAAGQLYDASPLWE